MPKRIWTDEKVAELSRFIAEGGSPARAVARFGCSEVALRTKAAQFGLRFPNLKQRRLRATGSEKFSVDYRN